MNSPSTANTSLHNARAERLRVVDVGRWLWVVTVAVLVLGFLVLRALSGVQDAPHVEPTDSAQLEVEVPPAATPEEKMHTLHPVTSQGVTSAPGFDDTPSVGLREPLLDPSWPGFTERVETASETPVVK